MNTGSATNRGPRRGFHPALWPTLFTVPALLVLLGLGTWQIQRLHWKEALIAARQAQLEAPPTPLPAGAKGLEALEFRRVSASGRFLHEAELYLVAPSLRGEAGYHVITPLVRSDGGGTVLVDRGWVPRERMRPHSRPEGQVEGPVTIDGIARSAGKQGMFVPDNEPERNLWYWRDLDRMAARLGLAVQPVFIEAGPAPNPGGWPLGGQTRTELRNEHLIYAITWYALAAVLIVIYVLWHRRRREPVSP